MSYPQHILTATPNFAVATVVLHYETYIAGQRNLAVYMNSLTTCAHLQSAANLGISLQKKKRFNGKLDANNTHNILGFHPILSQLSPEPSTKC